MLAAALWQAKSDVVAAIGAPLFPTRRERDILPAFHRIGNRRGETGSRELVRPYEPARFFVEGAQLAVPCSGDKDQAAGRDQWTTIRFRSGDGHALPGQLGVLSQRHPPKVFPRMQVDGIQRSPGRLGARVTAAVGE